MLPKMGGRRPERIVATVLITGATGFLGSRLAQALSVGGHDVIALTRDPAKADALQRPSG